MEETIWLGLDVHAGSITICKLVGQSDKELSWRIPNEAKDVRRTFSRLKQEGVVRACYEAGPCGYQLYRQLSELRIESQVIAPALIPRKAGDRVKTDRRDALKLARLYRAGELTTITVPTEAQETARDLVRARESIRRDRTAARQRLSKYLLRHGRRFPGTGWTTKHRIWLRGQEFVGTDRVVFDHYCAQVEQLDDRLASFEGEIQTLARTAEFKPVIDRLCCLPGIAELGAMVIVTELYDLRRFEHPRQLMAFLGLVSSEHSSGEKMRRGRLTKTGMVTCAGSWWRARGPIGTGRGAPIGFAAHSPVSPRRLSRSARKRG